MLPAIAVLHVRHGLVRQSGAVLGTIAGTATVAIGLAGSIIWDLRPSALVVLAVWWWTMGKMWAETGILPRPFGVLTATGAALVLVAALLLSLPGPGVWAATQIVIGTWLLFLAALLMRIPDVPSR